MAVDLVKICDDDVLSHVDPGIDLLDLDPSKVEDDALKYALLRLRRRIKENKRTTASRAPTDDNESRGRGKNGRERDARGDKRVYSPFPGFLLSLSVAFLLLALFLCWWARMQCS